MQKDPQKLMAKVKYKRSERERGNCRLLLATRPVLFGKNKRWKKVVDSAGNAKGTIEMVSG